MLHGNTQEIHKLIAKEADNCLYFAWDVTQIMPCNEEARKYLETLATWALNLSLPHVMIEEASGPMWGTFDIPGFVALFAQSVEDGYEYVLSDKKKEGIKKAMRARLSLLFEGVPRNKKAMFAMYPELAPVKKWRKKK